MLSSDIVTPTIGHMAPPMAEQVMPLRVRLPPTESVNLMLLAVSGPSLRTVITNSAAPPPVTVPAGPEPLTTRLLDSAVMGVVTIAELSRRFTSSASVAAIELVAVLLWVALAVAVTVNTSVPPTGRVGIVMTTLGASGQTAPPDAAQTIVFMTRKELVYLSWTSLAALLPTLLTVIVYVNGAPLSTASVGPDAVTATSLPEGSREPRSPPPSRPAQARPRHCGLRTKFPPLRERS